MHRASHTLYRLWNEYGLLAVVTTTGAAVLVIEIAATRVLSPYYGNTIYSVSSVISVILGALALGYWKGGKIADCEPTYLKFFQIIWRSALATLFLTIAALFLLPIGADFFSVRTGPLFWSVFLFFPAAYLLGMLSPFAITLGHRHAPKEGLGTMSGRIFFWSTAGSIFGSLLTGFVLIPYFGISLIFTGVTVFMLILGGIGVALSGPKKVLRERMVLLLLILIFVGLVYLLGGKATDDPRVRFTQDGVYERLSVLDTMHAGRPARFFLQDRSSSGGMFLDGGPLEHIFPYTSYVHLYRAINPNPSRALVIGGGIYTIPKALITESQSVVVDVVDIEPGLRELAREYFDLPDSSRIHSFTMDGRRFLEDAEEQYDIIYSDVYHSLFAIPTHFTTIEFFRAAQKKLTPTGLFLANVIGSSEESDASVLFTEIKTMKEAFTEVTVFAVNDPADTRLQNFILVGHSMSEATLLALLQNSNDPFLISLVLHHYPVQDASLAQAQVLTDNYAPIDHLVTQFLDMDVSPLTLEAKHATSTPSRLLVDGGSMMADIATIVGMGSRAIGDPGHQILQNFITTRITQLGFTATSDSFTFTTDTETTLPLTNIITRIHPDRPVRIVLGTHYDSLARAYRDPIDPSLPMPGANNGASGVALLLGLLPTMLEDLQGDVGVDVVFFDGEEGALSLGAGDPDWFPLGSGYFAHHLDRFYPGGPPKGVIIFDMVCDNTLSISPEWDSTQFAPEWTDRYFRIAHALAPATFTSKAKHRVEDDHTPFLVKRIPATLVIDFDDEHWNTAQDTASRCSKKSLETVLLATRYVMRSL
jgi:glutaminyl-peptide cyclotransferase